MKLRGGGVSFLPCYPSTLTKLGLETVNLPWKLYKNRSSRLGNPSMHTNLLLLLRYIYYLLRLPFNLLQTCPCLSLYCFPRVCLYFYLEGRSSPIIRVPTIFVFLKKQKKNIFSKYLMHLVLGYHENIFKTIFFIHIS